METIEVIQHWGHSIRWPRNIAGGNAGTMEVTKNRHHGVRCYGLHVGDVCHPYQPELLRNPVKQAVLQRSR